MLNPYLHAALGEQHSAMLRADSAAARQARLARSGRERQNAIPSVSPSALISVVTK